MRVLALFFVAAPLLAQDGADAVRAARVASNKAWAAGDIGAYAATITPDFVITSGNGGTNTHDTFVPLLTKAFADPAGQKCVRTPERIDVSATRPLAAERGHWECRSKLADGLLVATGTYMAMWRLDGGAWKTRSELFVTLDCRGSAACKPLAAADGTTPR